MTTVVQSYGAQTNGVGSRSPGFQWAGDATQYAQVQVGEDGYFIELVASPNNPDGKLQNAFLNGNATTAIYDLAYYWPHFGPITSAAAYDIMVFTLSTVTGHAGSRIGYVPRISLRFLFGVFKGQTWAFVCRNCYTFSGLCSGGLLSRIKLLQREWPVTSGPQRWESRMSLSSEVLYSWKQWWQDIGRLSQASCPYIIKQWRPLLSSIMQAVSTYFTTPMLFCVTGGRGYRTFSATRPASLCRSWSRRYAHFSIHGFRLPQVVP